MAGQSNLQPGSRAGPGPFRGACRDCLADPRAPREAWALQRPPAGGSGQAFEPARARSRARGRPEGGSEGLGSLGSAACRPVTDAGRLGGVLRHPSPAWLRYSAARRPGPPAVRAEWAGGRGTRSQRLSGGGPGSAATGGRPGTWNAARGRGFKFEPGTPLARTRTPELERVSCGGDRPPAAPGPPRPPSPSSNSWSRPTRSLHGDSMTHCDADPLTVVV